MTNINSIINNKIIQKKLPREIYSVPLCEYYGTLWPNCCLWVCQYNLFFPLFPDFSEQLEFLFLRISRPLGSYAPLKPTLFRWKDISATLIGGHRKGTDIILQDGLSLCQLFSVNYDDLISRNTLSLNKSTLFLFFLLVNYLRKLELKIS